MLRRQLPFDRLTMLKAAWFILYRSPICAAVVVSLVLGVAAIVTDRLENNIYRNHLRNDIIEKSVALSARLDQRMNLYVGALYTCEAMVVANPQLSKDTFEIITKIVTNHLPAFTSIQLAPNAIITYAYPLAWGKDIIGTNLRKDLTPANIDVVEKTILDGKLRVAGPRELVQGGTGIIARNPIYVDGKFWGFVTILIDFPTFLSGYPELQIASDIEYGLRGKDGLGANGEVFFGNEKLFDGDAVISAISFPNGQWLLAAKPRRGWRQDRPETAVFRSLSLMLILAIAGLTYIARERGNLILHLATTDTLTGILSRGHFSKLANAEIDRGIRHHRSLALIMLDIDHFKKVNDVFGHAAGDAVLQEVSRRVLEMLRVSDVFGRIGGEEFAIVAPETNTEQAYALAERIRLNIMQTPVHYVNNSIDMTISCGIASLSSELDSLDRLLLNADKALYLAKEHGRNQVCQ